MAASDNNVTANDYALALSLSRGKSNTASVSRKGSVSSVENDGAWRCEDCGKFFRSDRDKVLECEFCAKHFCIKCLKYKAGEYEATRKPGCMWFCMPCKPKIEKNILNEKMIEERCKFYFETINIRLAEVEMKLEGKCDETQVKEIVKKAIEEEGTHRQRRDVAIEATNGNANDKTMQETLKEVQDRRDRECNVMIFNAPEPETHLKEVREREDRELVIGLYNEVCGMQIDAQKDITGVIRLGIRPMEEGKPRPLKVLLREKETKVGLFKNLWKLREAEEKYKTLSIQHDLTKKEREEERKLMEESRAREARDEGKHKYRVRGPPWARKIVQLKPKRTEGATD